MPHTFIFTPALTKELRDAHDLAERSGCSEFMFHGEVMLTAYAKFLLEHLDNNRGRAIDAIRRGNNTRQADTTSQAEGAHRTQAKGVRK